MKGFDKKYKDFPDYILKITKQIWEGKDVDSIGEFYTDDIPVRSPFGITYGNKPVIEATYSTLKEFPNRQLLGEDVIWNGNDINGYHSSHRIFSKFFWSITNLSYHCSLISYNPFIVHLITLTSTICYYSIINIFTSWFAIKPIS